MKSVVLEIQNGFAAVLMEDGSILKLKDNNFKIGQVIEMKENKAKLSGKLIAIAASIAVFLVAAGIMTGVYLNPYTYVSLDVNPSIVFTVNQFNRVISVEAINDDGSVILSELDIRRIRFKNIEAAILDTIEQITADGYFSGAGVVSGSAYGVVSGSTYVVSGSVYNAVSGSVYQTVSGSVFRIQGGLVITISNEASNMGDADQLAEAIRAAVKSFVQEDVVVDVSSVGYDRVKEARNLGTTPGKLNLVEKLQESSNDQEEYSTDEWLHRSVRDIMTEIQINDAAARAENKAEKAEGQAAQNHNGSIEDSSENEDDSALAEDAQDDQQTDDETTDALQDDKAGASQGRSDENAADTHGKSDDAQGKAEDDTATLNQTDENAAGSQNIHDNAGQKADDTGNSDNSSSNQGKNDNNSSNNGKNDNATDTTTPQDDEKTNNGNDKNQGNGQNKDDAQVVPPADGAGTGADVVNPDQTVDQHSDPSTEDNNGKSSNNNSANDNISGDSGSDSGSNTGNGNRR